MQIDVLIDSQEVLLTRALELDRFTLDDLIAGSRLDGLPTLLSLHCEGGALMNRRRHDRRRSRLRHERGEVFDILP